MGTHFARLASGALVLALGVSSSLAHAQYTSPPPGGYPMYQEPPPPPPEKPESGKFEIPEFSVRIDPLNWLLEGRLGFELEVELWKFITVEMIPVFVVNDSPPTFNLRGRKDNLTQHSNGLGALAGTSLGVGFWLEGKPFEGNVLRAVFTNYGYEYQTTTPTGTTLDTVEHTERHLYGFFGSYRRWGFFTLGGGIGLGVELNKQERCFTTTALSSVRNSGCDGELQIALENPVTDVVDLNSPLYPVEFIANLSLGAVF